MKIGSPISSAKLRPASYSNFPISPATRNIFSFDRLIITRRFRDFEKEGKKETDQEDSFPHKINLNSLGCIRTTKDLENSYIQDTRTKIIPIKKISRAPIDPGVNLNLEEKIQLPCPNLKQKNPKIYSWR